MGAAEVELEELITDDFSAAFWRAMMERRLSALPIMATRIAMSARF